MIAYIQGTITHKDPNHLIVEAGGIGYQIRISLYTYAALKNSDKAKVLTYLSIKEDSHTLFGFSEELEKKIFLDLISISGVGPGTAMMVLSSLNPAEIQHAIASEDLRTIQAVKGIGAKTAQRIILELKDKMKKDQLVSPEFRQNTGSLHNTIRQEALSAMTTLGFAKAEAEKRIEAILKKQPDLTLEELIKIALKSAA